MKTKTSELLKAALELPAEDRAALAVELMDSIDGLPDDDAEAAWIAEIETRAERAHAGESSGSDLEAVRNRIERELKWR